MAGNATAIPHSAYSGVVWPAVPGRHGARILSLLFQMRHSEWWPPETLERWQMAQASQLLAHARRTVPFYAARDGGEGDGDEPLTMESFRRLPLLRRADLQESAEALQSREVPPEHGQLYDLKTSGTTGEPVRLKATEVTSLLYAALNVRYHAWHGRRYEGKTAALRTVTTPTGVNAASNWVPAFDSGPMVGLDVAKPIAEQFEWLLAEDPDYLLTYPSNLKALLEYARRDGRRPARLNGVSTLGEVLDPQIRDACTATWGVPLSDAYSAHEFGMIALQCPEYDHYHVQSERVVFEVIDDDGRPCGPGEAGRVVITDLQNFAMPLIRYENGDHAVLGAPCPCGRGLPVLTRVLGRTRNMMVLSSGDRIWPSIPAGVVVEIPAIRKIQLVQHRIGEIEAHLVVDRPLTDEEEGRLAASLRERMRHDFGVVVKYVDEIRQTAAGKLEDFVCAIDKK